jgi:lipid-A-disaccharide synthase
VDAVMAPPLRLMIRTPSIVLPNLVLDEKAFPELIQDYCTPANLASAVAPLLDDGPARRKQLAALARVPGRLELPRGTPSEAAADVVLYYAEAGRGWPHPELIGREG